MFWKSKKRQAEIIEYEQKIQKLKDEEASLKKIIADLNAEQTMAITEAIEHFQFALDFEAMQAFSVERIIRDGRARTIVGYFVKGEVKEWVLYTSAKEHNRIVAEFELWKSQKK